MQIEKIIWYVLPNTDNPCKYCHHKEAEWWATIDINEAGAITTQLCDDCVKLDDAVILERILHHAE